VTDRPVIQHHKGILHKWFGPNRGTHWTIAWSVVVILVGSYLVYSNRASNTIIIAIPAAEQAPAPIAPAPSTSEVE